jgi:preprotein translocase subunit SecG
MLYKLLLIILVLDALLLIAVILLQAGKGTGLAANFGGASSSPDAFIGVRQAGTILTKATWWCAGIFLALAFILQIMSTRAQAPRSVLEKTFSNQPAPPAPAPATGNPAIPLTPSQGGTTAPAPAGAAPVPLAPAAPPTAPPTPPPAAKK